MPSSTPPVTTSKPKGSSAPRSGCGRPPLPSCAITSTASRKLRRGATDAHKWLNVPYDCGIVFVADADAHRAAMAATAAYLQRGAGDVYEAYDYVPESSRRARGLSVYTALRSLGRSGVAELIDRCCGLARRMADRLGGA